MTINTGGQAFPRPYSKDAWLDEHLYAQDGMTLRDYFANQAMLGLVITYGSSLTNSDAYGSVSTTAYAISDAMLAERSK